MDYRYVIIGVNIIVLSTGFIIISLMENLELVLGMSLSSLILGIVILVIGLTYIEPLDKFYRASNRILSIILSKVLEDANLVYNSIMRTCLSKKNLLVISKQGIKCNDVYPGIGVVDGNPFIAVPLSLIVPDHTAYGAIENIDEYELESIVKNNILRNYNIGKDVEVKWKENKILIMFYGLRKEIIEILKKPVNPIKAQIIATISTFIGRAVVVENEEIVENNYVLYINVV